MAKRLSNEDNPFKVVAGRADGNEWQTSKVESLEELVIRFLVKEEDEDQTIRPRDLKTSEIPARRESKRHSDRVQWRGMQGSSNVVKAIYQAPNNYNIARVATGKEVFTDSPRDNGPGCGGSFRAH